MTEHLMSIGLIVIGLVLLFVAGDYLIKGAVAIARKLGWSPFVIGAVLVGFGTSFPELATSVSAALQGAPGIAIGNVVGSNIANVLLIAGVSALFFPAASPGMAILRRDGGAMIAATVIIMAMFTTGEIGRLFGAILVVGLVGYIWMTIKFDEGGGATADLHAKEADARAPDAEPALAIPLAAGFALGGLVGVLLGAQALVTGAVKVATALGVSDAVIGLTVVAIGTSLPELAASFAAIRQGRGDVAIGNIIGSNLFNILSILGITALITPVAVPAQIVSVDMWVMLAAALALLAALAVRKQIGRLEAAVFVAAYAGYTGYLVSVAKVGAG